jgi:NodT family efflux transporter outer membrane factor (OMF) lipoprotein
MKTNLNLASFMNRRAAAALILALPILPLAACATSAAPASTVKIPSVLESAAGNVAFAPVSQAWWEDFADPDLNGLVKEAISANRDLVIAVSRVRESRALAGVVESSLYPSVNATVSAGRNRPSVPPGTPIANLFQGGLSATWEADIFGGKRAELSRAGYELEGSRAAAKGAYLLVTTETVRRYLELAGLQRRLSVLDAAIGVQEKTLDLTAARYTAGLASRFDVERAQAQLDATRAQIPDVQNAKVSVSKAMALLLGRPLQEAPTVAGKSFTAKALPAQVPGEVLMGRPDIAVADAALSGQAQSLKSARLQWYPRFVFNLDGGRSRLESQGAAGLTTNIFGVQLGITTPIFDAGRIRSTIAANEARLDGAAAQYESVVLSAISDVVGAYRSYNLLQTRVERLSLARDSAHKAAATARALYQSGATDLLSVLTADSQALTREDEWVQAHALAPVAYLDVIRAFGGSTSAAEDWVSSANPSRK